jgi:hypothetical protein
MKKITIDDAALAKFPAPAVTTITPDEIAHANRPSTQMLLAMGALGKPMYGGTVDPVTKGRRRAANKRARIARRAGR